MKLILLSITLFLAIFLTMAFTTRYLYSLKFGNYEYNSLSLTLLIALFWSISICLVLSI
jgi:hypothetical protein